MKALVPCPHHAVTRSKSKFIEAWGTLGSSWGVPRTMAQIHALLLVSAGALSTEEVMESLQISRGNANMNLRNLMDWGLVEKELHVGERREYFKAPKDAQYIARQVAVQRKKRELEPMLRVLQELQGVEGADADTSQFRGQIGDIYDFALQSERMLNLFISSQQNWFMKALMKLTGKK
ncbi:GbsR/MarR family transcriptional regulator [Cesiribacter andamanensis]|uniref:HTH-type transcriptional regulator n=1 Tax=Cesiribacter andamanensis AMV16 TaxID=1279009 RepID=M7N014_9BACT|nr:MarR family transcriptional regulator [Cesiribacter andamanensis]EMR00637.1 putative transcriptional regulator [Cesiribacter andamanensis AMV16]